MVKENTPLVGIMISVFIAILLGVVMLSISAGQVNDITGKVDSVDGAQALTMLANTSANPATTYTVTNAPTGWKAQSSADGGCALTNFVLTNSTGTALTVTTDYLVDLQYGTYTLKDTAATNGTGYFQSANTTLATYTYCPDGYQTGFGGTTLNLVPGFFALAILVAGAFTIFYILRKEGIDI